MPYNRFRAMPLAPAMAAAGCGGASPSGGAPAPGGEPAAALAPSGVSPNAAAALTALTVMRFAADGGSLRLVFSCSPEDGRLALAALALSGAPEAGRLLAAAARSHPSGALRRLAFRLARSPGTTARFVLDDPSLDPSERDETPPLRR